MQRISKNVNIETLLDPNSPEIVLYILHNTFRSENWKWNRGFDQLKKQSKTKLLLDALDIYYSNEGTKENEKWISVLNSLQTSENTINYIKNTNHKIISKKAEHYYPLYEALQNEIFLFMTKLKFELNDLKKDPFSIFLKLYNLLYREKKSENNGKF
jgi:hypothetical protein